jgi:hypothetical protein
MSGIIYKVGRRPYVVSKFVETGDHAEITSPFLLSKDGKGYEHGGHGLFRQALRLPVAQVRVHIDGEEGMRTTAIVPSDVVTRFKQTKRTEPMFPEGAEIRRARFYDCRVGIGDVNKFLMSVEFTAQNSLKGLEVTGTVKYAVPRQNDPSTYATAFLRARKEYAARGLKLTASDFHAMTVEKPQIIADYFRETEGVPNAIPVVDPMFPPDMKIMIGNDVLLPSLEFRADVYHITGPQQANWRSLFVGYDHDYFQWETNARNVGSIGMTQEEAREAGKKGFVGKMNLYERDFKALYHKQKRGGED